ncbi:ComEC/Rec2 family competence protein [Candidatus Saccharibacteria bacterium]|nr:ComEC/Rec2 family competence protein [Candidatus Saccharibacteria bacterium]
MKQKRIIRRTTLLTVALALILVGLGLARRVELGGSWWIIVGAALVISGYALRRKTKIVLWVGIMLLALCVGWWRGSQYMGKVAAYDALYGKNTVMEVTALEDAVYSERGQLSFSASSIVVSEPAAQRLVGQVSVEGRGVPMVYRGDRLRVEGKLYPRRGANQAGINFAIIETLQHNISAIDTLRREFATGIQNSLPEPLASFGMGLLIGQRATLDKQITEQLTTTGLIHIVAVSGYNLTVIVGMSQRLFAKRSRYQSLVFSLGLIGVFLLMTGSSPSIVRAAIVSVMSLIAWYFGRQYRPLLLLLIAAALTAMASPLMVWSNIGWYLSFTAFFGVLVVGPLIKRRYVSSKAQERIIPSVLSETISAQICTLPILLFVFGRLSVVSVVANLLVVPLVPFAMLASLVAGIGGMIGPVIGSIVGLPARLLLDYILDVAALLSRVPKASIEVTITAAEMIYMYGLILFMSFVLWHKQRAHTGR